MHVLKEKQRITFYWTIYTITVKNKTKLGNNIFRMYYNSLKGKLSYWFCFTHYPILLSQQKTPPRCKLFYMRLPIFNHLEAPLVAWVANNPLQYRILGFDPWVGKITWRREWLSTPVFMPGEFQGQRSLVSYSPWGFNSKILMTEQPPLTFNHFLSAKMTVSYSSIKH